MRLSPEAEQVYELLTASAQKVILTIDQELYDLAKKEHKEIQKKVNEEKNQIEEKKRSFLAKYGDSWE